MTRQEPIVLLSALLCLSACSSGAPGSDSQPQHGPGWSFRLKSQCKNVPAEACAAGFGFTVHSDGRYTVGPGPQGETLNAPLPAEDFSAIVQGYKKAFGEPERSPESENCGIWHEDDSLLSVDLIRSAAETRMMRMTANELCTRARSVDDAKEFIGVVKRIVGKHYPLPFPDDSCDAATTALRHAYASVRRCSQDTDCVYVDESFEEVKASDFRFLSTGDCTGVRPLVVGNAQRIVAERVLLQESRERAIVSCKKRSATSACTGFAEFVPTRPGPVCRAGACKPSPATEIF